MTIASLGRASGPASHGIGTLSMAKPASASSEAATAETRATVEARRRSEEMRGVRSVGTLESASDATRTALIATQEAAAGTASDAPRRAQRAYGS